MQLIYALLIMFGGLLLAVGLLLLAHRDRVWDYLAIWPSGTVASIALIAAVMATMPLAIVALLVGTGPLWALGLIWIIADLITGACLAYHELVELHFYRKACKLIRELYERDETET